MTRPRAATRAVVFDMDGVLIDSGAHHREAWRAMLADVGVVPPADFWRLTIGRPSEEAVELLLGRRLPDGEALRLARLKRDHYVRLVRRGLLPIAGAPQFLAALARGDVPRAVGTSASRYDTERLLSELDLRRHFEVIVTSDDVRRGKPDPEVYLQAAEALAVRPEACVVFEDSVVGVHAARAAGMRAIGVTTAHSAAELTAAGAERAIADFEGLTWPL
ncbi:MAG: HAD family hydrolase [Candidatus Rokuibacteriota bacterium]